MKKCSLNMSALFSFFFWGIDLFEHEKNSIFK